MENIFENQKIIHDESFLDQCHPSIAAFYTYWRSKFQGDKMPSRQDFDPVDMVRYLPHITLVDADPDMLKLKYRLMGTAEVELRGYDPTGKLVKDTFLSNNWDDVVCNYMHVIEQKSFAYDYNDMPTKFGGIIADETIFLPLSADGNTVNIVILYSVQNKKQST